MALQATPQSGRKHPVINASYNDQLNIDMLFEVLENIPHAGMVNKTRCPFRPWLESISERIFFMHRRIERSVWVGEGQKEGPLPHFRGTQHLD